MASPGRKLVIGLWGEFGCTTIFGQACVPHGVARSHERIVESWARADGSMRGTPCPTVRECLRLCPTTHLSLHNVEGSKWLSGAWSSAKSVSIYKPRVLQGACIVQTR